MREYGVMVIKLSKRRRQLPVEKVVVRVCLGSDRADQFLAAMA
jgi:hypothetical protein